MALMDFVPVFFGGQRSTLAAGSLQQRGLCAGLSVLSVKLKKGSTIVLFALSFVFAMAMGYMSGQNFALSWVIWAEQSINTVSQLCLMLGVIALHKAGLKKLTWENGK